MDLEVKPHNPLDQAGLGGSGGGSGAVVIKV